MRHQYTLLGPEFDFVRAHRNFRDTSALPVATPMPAMVWLRLGQ